jgi:hypothetical protein
MRWSDKDPAEIVSLGVDMALLLADGETITAVSSALTVASGIDATPSALLLSTPAIVGTTVQQWVRDGVDGVLYRLSFTVDTSIGKRLVESGLFRVVTQA